MKQIMIAMMALMLAACGHDGATDSRKTKMITVQPHKLVTTLYYSGVVQPLKTVIITTPADGAVAEMTFHYGDVVKQGQSLFTIASDKFQADYKTALMNYIKAKTEFTNNQNQLRENEFLHKNQLISDDEYKSKESGFFNAKLALIQAKDALSIYLRQMNLNDDKLFSLSIKDVDKIDGILHAQNAAQLLRVAAPVSGVVLLPVKNDMSDAPAKKIMAGEQVKQGDVLAMIGDVSGLTIHITVNEFNVNQIKLGQKVKVTGTAFAEGELEGKIAGVDRQGQMGQGGMPVFAVDVVVPTLTPAQQQVIHMGMSAKVAIQIDGPEAITVPMTAITEKNGLSYVQVANGRRVHDVQVKTGQATQDEVVIENNLKAGDQIVVVD